nr:Chain B, SMALL PEPTIDE SAVLQKKITDYFHPKK [Homo sapiens]1VYJ_D Chain D, SMALL PEPTIDE SAVLQKKITDYFHPKK [Homo sapiens]1VYJ_F Chain F, SMALL PEPTIDE SAVLQKKITDYFHPKK [Homo sapiens]1VYJ_H Chain H, SMALL PEPTIDE SAVLQKKITDYFHPKK [Homo sapiens]1VYJ_J Chain J, SMALL PEPTIDE SAVLQKKITDYFHPKK [Homo sapiens]1VYJ_L Chain L, SMALL PEPTIDE SAVLQKKITDYFHPKK [Homo sapiens]
SAVLQKKITDYFHPKK